MASLLGLWMKGTSSRYTAVSHNLTISPALLLPTILGGFVPPQSSTWADQGCQAG